MKKYRIMLMLLVISVTFTACKKLIQTPTSASGESTLSTTSEKPLRN